MNHLLVKHRPSEVDIDDWKKHWENAAYTLEPLAKALIEMRNELNKIKADDFDCPNHYAKLASQQMQIALINKILEMLPASVEKN